MNNPKPNGKEESPWPALFFILSIVAFILLTGIGLAQIIVAFPK